MFTGFFGILLAFFLTLFIAAGVIHGIIRTFAKQKRQRRQIAAVQNFIRENSLDQCEWGFYGDKEIELADALGISRNQAYALISSTLKTNPNRK